jgi:hypothetical protein
MDFSKIDDSFSKEIVRGGEAYLEGQLRIATSADQRASSLSGIFTAAATALLAATVALANPAWNFAGRPALLAGAVAAASMFLIGAFQCLRAVMPVSFWIPGCEPENWESDCAAGKQLKDCLGERAKNIQEQIDANSKVMKDNATNFLWGASFGFAAPVLGAVIWVLISAYIWASQP